MGGSSILLHVEDVTTTIPEVVVYCIFVFLYNISYIGIDRNMPLSHVLSFVRYLPIIWDQYG